MAPAVVTAVPPPLPHKIKPPPPPTVQTNGATPSQSSPPPPVSATKPSSVPPSKNTQPSSSVDTSSKAASGGVNRPTAPRARRDTLTASGSRAQKNHTALRSGGPGPDKPLSLQFEPRPEGQTPLGSVVALSVLTS